MESDEVSIHSVTTEWPDAVGSIARLLAMPLPQWLVTGPHPDGIESSKLQAMLSSELVSHYRWTVVDPPSAHVVKDFFRTVVSTVSDLRTLCRLPTEGTKRSTVAIWLRLFFSLGTCIGDNAILLEEIKFIKPRSRAGVRSMADVEGIAIFMATYGLDLASFRQRSPESGLATNTDNAIPNAPSTIECSSPISRSSAGFGVCGEEFDEYRHSEPQLAMSMDQCDKIESECNNQRSRSSDRPVSMCSEDLSQSSSVIHEDTKSHSLEFFSDGRSLTTESSGKINGPRSVSSDKCVNLPLQAHMIPTLGVRSCFALPILVVAEEGTIMPLIRSTLYQRHVLGIREPVVGFIGSRTGTVFRVIIGWLSPDVTLGSDLPEAHVAFSPNPYREPNQLLGTFDLAEPLSAFCMAQFIMQVFHRYLSALHATPVGDNCVDVLSWRSDGIDYQFHLGEQWKERVTRWACGVCGEEDSSDIDEEEGSPNTSELQKHAQTPKSTSIWSAKREQTGRKNVEGSVTKTRYSNSSFAALPNQGLSSSHSTSNWLFERRAFTISCVKLGQSDAEGVEIDGMINKYQDITSSAWPKEWKSLDNLPSVDSSAQSGRIKLFQNYESHIMNSTASFGAMDAEAVTILISRFHAILNASLGALSREMAAATLGVNEPERRHDWDSLLTSAYVPDFSHPENIVHNALLERTLNSARNGAADDINGFIATQKDLAQQYESLCLKALYCASETFSGISVVARQCAAAYTDATTQHSAVDTCLDVDTQKMVMKHSRLDPETARCDAILVVQCRIDAMRWLQEELSECRKKFELVIHPIAEGKARSNEGVGDANQPTSSKDRHLLHDPFHSTPRKAIQGDVSIGFNSLSLPILVTEYKKKDNSGIFKAMNQCRIYLVSAVRFLEALNITDQPVFGLVTKGAEGSILMAWLSGETKKIYIIDRNVKTFDLTNPLDAFQFATILVRLSKHAQELKTKFEDEHYQSVLREIFKSGIPQWSKRFQNTEVKVMQSQDISQSTVDVVVKN